MVDRGKKAGTFIKETVEDIHEIGSGLTERGVASELIERQKGNFTRDNLAAGSEHITEKIGERVGPRATPSERKGKAASELADFDVSRGADTAEARRVAEGLIAHPDDPAARQAARELKEKMKGPEAIAGAKPEKADGKEKASGDAKAALAQLKAGGAQGVGGAIGQVEAAIASMQARLTELTAGHPKAQTRAKSAPKVPDTPSEAGVVINKDGSHTVPTYRVDAAGRKVPVTTDYDRDGNVVRQTTVDSKGQVVPAK